MTVEVYWQFDSDDKFCLLKENLESLGFDESDWIETDVLNEKRLAVFVESKEDIDVFKKLKPQVKQHKESEWKQKTFEDFTAFDLTDRFQVVPTLQEISKDCIYVGEGYGFGSGKHPTTRAMSQLIQDHLKSGETFFDVGTGSGILSIVAHKCGASEIDLLDICPDSIQTANENLIINQVQASKIFLNDLSDFREQKQYDFVAANLITPVLIENNEILVNLIKPGGMLAISGIMLRTLQSVLKLYDNLNSMKKVNQIVSEGWATILYQKEVI